ncbi:hypothetical protein [Polyangium sp. 6x1]|uniref:hypothetical protein n=1 Tax=Polyangium sp. 6x1 TaxID=3042689 RepID=UPI002483006D|nr:hypothetical protein [Polyangium sp. 6x1]MDI1444631.1 hypothetical protein [Polyangium sp. 6x1]
MANDQDEDQEREDDGGRGVALLAAGLALGAAAVGVALAHRKDAPDSRTSAHVRANYRRFAPLGAIPPSHPMLHPYLPRAARVQLRLMKRLGIGDELGARLASIFTPGRGEARKHTERWNDAQRASDPWTFGVPREWRVDGGRWRWVNVPPRFGGR